MEVVNKNVESKNKTLEYLKSIKSSGTNKHEEKEFKNLIVSVVLINTTFSSLDKIEHNYNVGLVCLEKGTDIIYNNIKNKDFKNEEEANIYYNDLKKFINNTSEENIYSIINESND